MTALGEAAADADSPAGPFFGLSHLCRSRIANGVVKVIAEMTPQSALPSQLPGGGGGPGASPDFLFFVLGQGPLPEFFYFWRPYEKKERRKRVSKVKEKEKEGEREREKKKLNTLFWNTCAEFLKKGTGQRPRGELCQEQRGGRQGREEALAAVGGHGHGVIVPVLCFVFFVFCCEEKKRGRGRIVE